MRILLLKKNKSQVPTQNSQCQMLRTLGKKNPKNLLVLLFDNFGFGLWVKGVFGTRIRTTGAAHREGRCVQLWSCSVGAR